MAGPRTLRTFCQLLSYPSEQTMEASELLYIILQSELPEAASEIAQFGKFIEQSQRWELEEAFTAVFEVNPACALEIGWHLFGEDYERGMLLVRLREELRKYGLSEQVELPDHLIHVLPLIGAMEEGEARRFVQACVLPAVARMRQAFERIDSPYGAVVRALAMVMQSVWGDGRPLSDGLSRYRADGNALPDGVDLLHAFPAADAPVELCGGCHGGCGHDQGSPPLVQLATPIVNQEEAYQ